MHEVRQRIAKAAEVRSRHNRVSHDLTLIDEVTLMNLRELEAVLEVLHCPRRRCRVADQVRVDRQERTVVSRDTAASSRQVVRSRRELTLSALDNDAPVEPWGVEDGGQK